MSHYIIQNRKASMQEMTDQCGPAEGLMSMKVQEQEREIKKDFSALHPEKDFIHWLLTNTATLFLLLPTLPFTVFVLSPPSLY